MNTAITPNTPKVRATVKAASTALFPPIAEIPKESTPTAKEIRHAINSIHSIMAPSSREIQRAINSIHTAMLPCTRTTQRAIEAMNTAITPNTPKVRATVKAASTTLFPPIAEIPKGSIHALYNDKFNEYYRRILLLLRNLDVDPCIYSVDEFAKFLESVDIDVVIVHRLCVFISRRHQYHLELDGDGTHFRHSQIQEILLEFDVPVPLKAT